MACNEAITRCDRGTKLPGRPSGSRTSMPARLGTGLQQLAERAAESGWTEDEIAYALLELAGTRLKSNSANRETERAIDRARATR